MGALAVMAGDEKPTSVRRQGLSGGFAWQAAFLDRVAGDPASLRRQQQRWLDPAAPVGVRAAWIEGAAAGRVERPRQLAAQPDALAALGGIGLARRRPQGLGEGVLRIGEDGIARQDRKRK